MIVPFDLDQLNPASYDLLLGNEIMIESAVGDELVRVDISEYSQGDPYYLRPGQWILAETWETFNMPDDIAGLFFLKSSRAREGLEHLMAGYCDPGWHGSTLTMELHNSRQLQPVPLWPGMKIGQMIFYQMAGIPQRSYAITGRYNGYTSVQQSKG